MNVSQFVGATAFKEFQQFLPLGHGGIESALDYYEKRDRP